MATFKQRKYEQIQGEISEQIQRGLLAPGRQLPTEQDLAESYGVSRLTVRQAIAGLIRSGVAYSVQGKGTFVSEKKAAVKGELKTIHFIGTSLHQFPDNDFFSNSLMANLAVEATRKGYALTISMIPRHMTFQDFLRGNGLPPTFNGGVILSSVIFTPLDAKLLQENRIPFVSLRSESLDASIPCVGSDFPTGMKQCMKILHDYGHSEIGVVNWPVEFGDFKSNLEIYRAGLEKAGGRFSPDKMVMTAAIDETEGALAVHKLLEQNPHLTAIVIFGDRISAGGIRELLNLGYRIPEDISVVVNDRYFWLDSLFPFRLTGSQQNLSGISIALLDLLDDQRKSGVTQPRQVMVPPDWISGNSMGFPKNICQLQQQKG